MDMTGVGELLERSAELQTLHQAVDAAASGSHALVVVHGEAGIGKSTLLGALRQLAQRRGLHVLSAVGAELDQDVPFAVVSSLLRPVLAYPDKAARLFTGQAAVAMSLFDGAAPMPTDSDGLVRGLYWLVAALASEGKGLALVVDDVQWADRASVRFLLHLATQLEGLPVALVVARRAGEPAPPSDLLDRMAGLRSASVLSPAPLSPAAVAGIVTAALPEAPDDVATACVRATGGNPFLVQELVDALARDGCHAAQLSPAAVQRTLPDAVARGVLVRLAALPESARALARAVAVLGSGAPVELAAGLAGLSMEHAGRAADELAAARLFSPGAPLAFLHPLVEAVVREDIPSFARAAAHRRAAELMTAAGAPPETTATHLVLTLPAGRQATVGVLRAAAASASARGEPLTSVRYLHRAIAEPPPEEEAVELLIELGRAQSRADDPAAPATVALALERAVGADQRVRALALKAEICFAAGDLAGVVSAADQARDLVDPDDPRAEHLLAQQLTAGLMHAPSRPRVERHLDALAARGAAGRLPDNPTLLAHLTLRSALGGGRAAEVRSLAERAVNGEALVDPSAHGLPLGLVVHGLVSVDELVAAESAAEAAVAAARQRGDEVAHALACFHRAIPRYHRGDLLGVLADVEPAARRSEQVPAAIGFLAHLLVLSYLARGDMAAARSAAARTAGVAPDSLDGPLARFAIALLALADGDPQLASESATCAGAELQQKFGIDHPGFLPWRTVVARAEHALGHSAAAHRAAEEALERARWTRAPRPLAHALRAAAAVGHDPVRALALLREAVDVLSTSAADLERAAALTDLGVASRRSGDTAAAQRLLREGYALAESLHAAPVAERSRKELVALGLRPRRAAVNGLDALTPSERRVAELVASGLSNRQVAEALFVTTKTVETHLAAVYRKLGVNSRREAAERIHIDRRR